MQQGTKPPAHVTQLARHVHGEQHAFSYEQSGMVAIIEVHIIRRCRHFAFFL